MQCYTEQELSARYYRENFRNKGEFTKKEPKKKSTEFRVMKSVEIGEHERGKKCVIDLKDEEENSI